MGYLVFGNAERPGKLIDAAEIPIVRDNDVELSGKESGLPKDPKRPRRKHVT